LNLASASFAAARNVLEGGYQLLRAEAVGENFAGSLLGDICVQVASAYVSLAPSASIHRLPRRVVLAQSTNMHSPAAWLFCIVGLSCAFQVG
jgi:hypothetical protein